MMKFISCLTVLSAFNVRAVEPMVTLAGIQTVWNDTEKEFGGSNTFSSEKGSAAVILISISEGDIVSFDDDKAKFTLGGKPAKIRFLRTISNDHKHLRLEIETAVPIPVGEIAGVKIEGTLPVTISSGISEIKSEVIDAKAGTKVTFPEGKLPARLLTVEKVGKPEWGDDLFEVGFKSDREFYEFAAINFTTADGTVLEASKGRTGTMTMMGKTSAEVSYTFKQKVDKLVMVLSAWTGLKTKVLKISLSAADAK